MSRPKYSRLIVPRKAKDDSIIGRIWLFEPLGFEERGPDLVAYFRHAPAARAAGRELDASRVRHELVTDIPEEDPLEAYRAASRPFPVGRRLWIDPGSPTGAPSPDGRVAIRVPASRAFGTGSHESTRLALAALEEESLGSEIVLDVGTGSGVLALAAVALGARIAVGFDSDPQAVFVARENAALHPFGDRVALVACEIVALDGSFPLVIANLLPEELLPMRSAVCARVAARGRLVVSGIPTEREEEVVIRLKGRQWTLTGCRRDNGWTCVTLERG